MVPREMAAGSGYFWANFSSIVVNTSAFTLLHTLLLVTSNEVVILVGTLTSFAICASGINLLNFFTVLDGKWGEFVSLLTLFNPTVFNVLVPAILAKGVSFTHPENRRRTTCSILYTVIWLASLGHVLALIAPLDVFNGYHKFDHASKAVNIELHTVVPRPVLGGFAAGVQLPSLMLQMLILQENNSFTCCRRRAHRPRWICTGHEQKRFILQRYLTELGLLGMAAQSVSFLINFLNLSLYLLSRSLLSDYISNILQSVQTVTDVGIFFIQPVCGLLVQATYSKNRSRLIPPSETCGVPLTQVNGSAAGHAPSLPVPGPSPVSKPILPPPKWTNLAPKASHTNGCGGVVSGLQGAEKDWEKFRPGISISSMEADSDPSSPTILNDDNSVLIDERSPSSWRRSLLDGSPINEDEIIWMNPPTDHTTN